MPPGPPCQALWQAHAVFAGRVVQVRDVDPRDAGGPLSETRRVTVRVTEDFRSTVPDEVEVFTGRGGGDCGYDFSTGGAYLIYAYRSAVNGRWTTGICSRTKPLSHAGDDLKYLRGASPVRKATGELFGRVERIGPDRSGVPAGLVPVEGVSIVATSGGAVYQTTSTRDGKYAMKVPTGRYRLVVEASDTLYAMHVPVVDVTDDRACGEARVYLRWNGTVTGRVVTPAGAPVPFFVVELATAAELESLSFVPLLRARTDSDGRFEVSRVPPGTFHIGLDTAHVRGSAASAILLSREGGAGLKVEVSGGARIAAGDLVLPAATAFVELSGLVVGASGAPARGAAVYLRTESLPGARISPPVVMTEDGRFRMTAIAGRRYRLVVEAHEDGKFISRAESPAFEATATRDDFVLTLQPVRAGGS